MHLFRNRVHCIRYDIKIQSENPVAYAAGFSLCIIRS